MPRTLFVGDVHSCAFELRTLLEQNRPDRVILLGDVFNKGPDPDGTWDVVRQWQCESVLGNHDLVVLETAERAENRVPKSALSWIQTLPLTISGDGWVAVHAGVNPEGDTTPEQAVRLRRWPDDSSPKHPFWWEMYQGDDLIIYGHDAARGIQDHCPHTLGLDSGCVYGGRLSGYLLEEDRIVSVQAREQYRAI